MYTIHLNATPHNSDNSIIFVQIKHLNINHPSQRGSRNLMQQNNTTVHIVSLGEISLINFTIFTYFTHFGACPQPPDVLADLVRLWCMNTVEAIFEHETQDIQTSRGVNLGRVFACLHVFATSFKVLLERVASDEGMAGGSCAEWKALPNQISLPYNKWKWKVKYHFPKSNGTIFSFLHTMIVDWPQR